MDIATGETAGNVRAEAAVTATVQRTSHGHSAVGNQSPQLAELAAHTHTGQASQHQLRLTHAVRSDDHWWLLL